MKKINGIQQDCLYAMYAHFRAEISEAIRMDLLRMNGLCPPCDNSRQRPDMASIGVKDEQAFRMERGATYDAGAQPHCQQSSRPPPQYVDPPKRRSRPVRRRLVRRCLRQND